MTSDQNDPSWSNSHSPWAGQRANGHRIGQIAIVSRLSNLSKIYECCMYTQTKKYFGPILSKYQFGFRGGYSAHQCLHIMIEKWRASLDQNETWAVLSTNLSKAFDCLPNDLLIAKVHAYGCDLPSLKLLNCYLHNRRKRVKINNFYSSWAEILFGVSQGSILGPILFNIFLSDLFLLIKNKDVANYADDATPYKQGEILHLLHITQRF